MDRSDTETPPLARVAASPGRRILALIVIYSLGGLLLWMGFAVAQSVLSAVLPWAMAVGTLYLAERLRAATRSELVLDAQGLWDADGTLLAEMAEIVAVDRGALAIKPSNGFTLKLSATHPRVWRPGMWWRIGNRVGVGGILSAGATRFMAEQIAAQITLRGGD